MFKDWKNYLVTEVWLLIEMMLSNVKLGHRKKIQLVQKIINWHLKQKNIEWPSEDPY